MNEDASIFSLYLRIHLEMGTFAKNCYLATHEVTQKKENLRNFHEKEV